MSENDSDLEVLDPGILRASYFRQQLRLIYELDQCGKKIPRNFLEFEAFIDENIEWQPSAHLVHSTWLKLNCAEEQSRDDRPVDVVEISDEDSSVEISDDVPFVKNSFIGKKHAHSKNINKPKSNVLWEADLTVSVSSETSSTKIGSKKKRKKRSSVEEKNLSITGSPSKTPLKKQKKSSGIKMTEAEAEALREQLLIDKIIELELPKVIKSIISDNTVSQNELPKIVKNVVKGTRKRRSMI